MQVDRIFVSSTFLDFAWEREFLNTTLVPALNEELRTEGREIDLLDLRWGVSRHRSLGDSVGAGSATLLAANIFVS